MRRAGLGGKLADMEDQAVERYVVRPGARGSRVVEVETGETVVIAQVPQDRLSAEDAEHTARMLNQRAAGGERKVVG